MGMPYPPFCMMSRYDVACSRDPLLLDREHSWFLGCNVRGCCVVASDLAVRYCDGVDAGTGRYRFGCGCADDVIWSLGPM